MFDWRSVVLASQPGFRISGLEVADVVIGQSSFEKQPTCLQSTLSSSLLVRHMNLGGIWLSLLWHRLFRLATPSCPQSLQAKPGRALQLS